MKKISTIALLTVIPMPLLLLQSMDLFDDNSQSRHATHQHQIDTIGKKLEHAISTQDITIIDDLLHAFKEQNYTYFYELKTMWALQLLQKAQEVNNPIIFDKIKKWFGYTPVCNSIKRKVKEPHG